MARRAMSKKLRFEVFKRDHFSCQYCGAKAPEAVLHIDHIKPVSKGGKNEILNLVTACSACNLGKGARELSDAAAVSKQRHQLDELAARREQLEMIVNWRDQIEGEKTENIEAIANQMEERGGYTPSESGKSKIRKWLRDYSLQEVLLAVDEAFDIYMRWSGDEPDRRAWEIAFGKVPGVLRVLRQRQERPWLRQLFYIQGILRRRFDDPHGNYVAALEHMVTQWVADPDMMQDEAKRAASWDAFQDAVHEQSEAPHMDKAQCL